MEATPVPRKSPPHTSPIVEVIVQDVIETIPQNINSLTTKDLKKILNQSIDKATFCKKIVLVSEEEYQKALSDTKSQPSNQTKKTPNKVYVETQEGQ